MLKNGTGGLLVVDIDPKNGGSVESLRRRFPDLLDTRTVQTVTPHPDGFGVHLIYTIPDDVRVATNRRLGVGIDVPHWAMLPGSKFVGDDGIERMYELIDDREPAAAPPGLIAAVDKGVKDELLDNESPSYIDPDDSVGLVDALVKKFANAYAGERNETFVQVAPTVIRLKGEEGADMLRNAYTGDDDGWLESALSSALTKYDGSSAPSRVVRTESPYISGALAQTMQSALYGKWPGAGGASDRRVFVGVTQLCLNTGMMHWPASVRTLALVAGLEPKTVSKAVARLVKSGRLYAVETDDGGTPDYAPIPGELTTVLVSKGMPLGIPVVDPLHDVWMSDGLTGRHGQVFDLVSVGITRANDIAKAGGMGYDTARDALSKLVNVGLLLRQGTVYTVPAGVVEIAGRLADELGGTDRREKLASRVLEERLRPRGDAAPAPAVADDNSDDDLRDFHEQELLRQLGLI
ncbi:hypothetical protein AWC05_00805 [Mycobacterium florentinum]|uniref:DNA primase/polymerase bifunctional N-terminal domain-containing protein n=2 Tax=Mycobacterium florentinum TaxID=292462 RepID=A0A1X1TYP3_MYCFL|nr:hypothetical protein AWC05_00805 [Mycobacterium florentinum]